MINSVSTNLFKSPINAVIFAASLLCLFIYIVGLELNVSFCRLRLTIKYKVLNEEIAMQKKNDTNGTDKCR